MDARTPTSISLDEALERTLQAVGLRSSSGNPWLRCALGSVNALLDDHGQCELKAAANALSMVVRNPQYDSLVRRMSSLAKEEMHHYRIVRQVLVSRGQTPSRPEANPYMKELGRGRRGRDEALLDDLIIAAIVEARSCERFVVLAHALDGPAAATVEGAGELAALYGRLAKSECGHARLFLNLAHEYFEVDLVARELDRRLELESQILAELSVTARMHGGMAGGGEQLADPG
jgi:tRNA 2-(methylsulfanyl)-N6-isopentenyladenosine37 hydroxylase